MPQINQADRARVAWNALQAVAALRRTTTYAQLGATIGVHHRTLRYALGPIQDYCIEEGLPPLTILVVNSSGLPGKGFIAFDLDNFDEGLEAVWSRDWKSIQNPFDFTADGTTYEAVLKDLIQSPEDAEDVYVRVKSRGIKQLLFRDALRKAYSSQCAFSGIWIPEVLEACHIVPWSLSTPQQRMDVRNGILLNSLHHRLFDEGYLTLSTEYHIKYCDPKGSERVYSSLERALTVSLNGQPMRLPRLSKHYPLVINIEQHNTLLDWKL